MVIKMAKIKFTTFPEKILGVWQIVISRHQDWYRDGHAVTFGAIKFISLPKSQHLVDRENYKGFLISICLPKSKIKVRIDLDLHGVVRVL